MHWHWLGCFFSIPYCWLEDKQKGALVCFFCSFFAHIVVAVVVVAVGLVAFVTLNQKGALALALFVFFFAGIVDCSFKDKYALLWIFF
jgi:hypothetical protein